MKEVRKERAVFEPHYSKIEHTEDWWEPMHALERFAARMECDNASCGENVFVTGMITTSYGGYNEEGDIWLEALTPRTVCPAVPVFQISAGWPDAVIVELRQAFGHIWLDPGAAANRLRIAVERLLDHFKIPRATFVSKGGGKKKVQLTTHERILLFYQSNAPAADLLLAIKWIGNAGSHADPLGMSRDDVLDGMTLMEHALHLLFDKSAAIVAKLASQINKKKGPIGPTKKKP